MTSALTPASTSALETRFRGYDRLTVRQKKKWLEILLSFELKNAYQVFDGAQAVLDVKETGSGLTSFLARMLLGPLRPLQVAVTDIVSGELLLSLRRPFRFIFHRLEVSAGDGTALGSIQKRWSWIRRIYVIEDAQGRELAQIFGPFLKPWTFEIKEGDRVLGAIRKRFSGLGKEIFTDADNFGIELGGIDDLSLRALSFAATVLIDVVHFERAKG